MVKLPENPYTYFIDYNRYYQLGPKSYSFRDVIYSKKLSLIIFSVAFLMLHRSIKNKPIFHWEVPGDNLFQWSVVHSCSLWKLPLSHWIMSHLGHIWYICTILCYTFHNTDEPAKFMIERLVILPNRGNMMSFREWDLIRVLIRYWSLENIEIFVSCNFGWFIFSADKTK